MNPNWYGICSYDRADDERCKRDAVAASLKYRYPSELIVRRCAIHALADNQEAQREIGLHVRAA